MKSLLKNALAGAGIFVASMAGTANAQVITTLLSEGFDTGINGIQNAGWVISNNSSPAGSASWFTGNTSVFLSQNGPDSSYVGVNFNSTTGANNISNWLLSPTFGLGNNVRVSFYTRTVTGSTFADRLRVYYSKAGVSEDVGTTTTSLGDFTEEGVIVNDALVGNGYPGDWTEYTFFLSGIAAGQTGRLGFNYNVTDGGPSGANSNYIGIDNVRVELVSAADVEEFNSALVGVFPNPASDFVNFEAGNFANGQDLTISMYNVEGKKVWNGSYPSYNGNTISADVSGFAAGVYSVEFVAGTKSQIQKVVVSK